MKTEFPLLDSLIMNGELPPLPPIVKLVEAQDATDKYWLDENDVWSFSKDFGCMTPPYPFMWIESTALLPASAPVKGKIVSDSVIPLRMGFKVDSYKEDQFYEIARTMGRKFDLMPFAFAYMFELCAETNRWPSVSPGRCLPARGYLTVDEQGSMVQCWVETQVPDPEDGKYLQQLMWSAGRSAFYAISMMNCRNVKVEPRMTTTRGGKKSRRPRKPSVEYHKIHLPTPRATGGESGTTTGATKLHTARGHFKTYTEEAPLMGRHVGTYYWGWQVRGNRKNGEIISSYQVGATA